MAVENAATLPEELDQRSSGSIFFGDKAHTEALAQRNRGIDMLKEGLARAEASLKFNKPTPKSVRRKRVPQDGLINEPQIIIEDKKAALESAMVDQSETFRFTLFDRTPLIKLVSMRQNGLQSPTELYDLYINWERH